MLSSVPGPVSVVIPTFNRGDRLMRTIEALECQIDAPPFEVVVADDGSTDDTVDRVRSRVARSSLNLCLVPEPANTGPAGARNRGWRAAHGDRVLFTDDDCVPSPGWVAAMAAALAEVDVVTGPIAMAGGTRNTVGPFGSYLDVRDDGSFSTGNVGYRRSVLEQLGGFDEATFSYRRPRGVLHCINGEDADLGRRAMGIGARSRYVPEAVVHHDVAPSRFRSHLRSMRRLEGMVILVGRHPSERQRLGIGYFLRSVDKAVILFWAAAALSAARPRRQTSWACMAVAGAIYSVKCWEARPPARSLKERLATVPGAFVADNYALGVMVASSVHHRTLLL